MEKKVSPAMASYEIITISHSGEYSNCYVALDSCKTRRYLIKVLTEQCSVRINVYGVSFKHSNGFEFIPREKGNAFVSEYVKDRWVIKCHFQSSPAEAAKWLINEARMLQAIEEN